MREKWTIRIREDVGHKRAALATRGQHSWNTVDRKDTRTWSKQFTITVCEFIQVTFFPDFKSALKWMSSITWFRFLPDLILRIRKSTWEKLLSLQNGRLGNVMRRVLSHDPLAPILTDLHLQAMDRRLVVVIATIQKCLSDRGAEYVLLSWGTLFGVANMMHACLNIISVPKKL